MNNFNGFGQDAFDPDHILQSIFRGVGFNEGFGQDFGDSDDDIFSHFFGMDGLRFDRGNFANNFQQQFRSTGRAGGGNMFDDLIRMAQERSFND